MSSVVQELRERYTITHHCEVEDAAHFSHRCRIFQQLLCLILTLHITRADLHLHPAPSPPLYTRALVPGAHPRPRCHDQPRGAAVDEPTAEFHAEAAETARDDVGLARVARGARDRVDVHATREHHLLRLFLAHL